MATMNFDEITKNVGEYYTSKVIGHGATPQGVDWSSKESQSLRFEQLLKVCDHQNHLSINDYGCGYGALIDYMNSQKYQFSYFGYDISPQMLKQARETYDSRHIVFCDRKSDLPISDYTVASGIFNVKQNVEGDEWQKYILLILDDLSNLSLRGFAFNILTKYSDAEKMRSDLYYADPCFLFDYCKTNFSKNVAILHDYNLYEFTIVVRKTF
jgi:SAM-dependent methyltransferase